MIFSHPNLTGTGIIPVPVEFLLQTACSLPPGITKPRNSETKQVGFEIK